MTDDLDQPEDDGMELVMPFVTVASKGGPHDDAAYAAGWESATWDARLQMAATAGASRVEAPFGVHADNTPQLDLIAMKHGYRMVDITEQSEVTVEGWTPVRFESDNGQGD